MEKYQKPEISIIKIEESDIITVSGFEPEIDISEFQDE